jgi:nucleoside-diphosphate-sugar epimerase
LHAVVHLAAAGAHGARDELDLVPANVVGTHRLAVRAWQSGKCRFVSIGSALEYGGRGELDGSPEQGFSPFLETDLCEPRDPYGASKLASMELVLAHARRASREAIHLRLCALYGPDAPASDLTSFLVATLTRGTERIPLTGGAQVREWLSAHDAANAVVAAVMSERFQLPMVINVSSGEPMTVRALAESLSDLTGQPRSRLGFGDHPYRPGEARYLAQDITRAASELGWSPSASTRVGLAKLLETRR